MPRGRKRIEGTCSTEGCGKPSVVKGMCRNHYARAWMAERPDTKSTLKRNHPLYSIWFERKQRGSLCATWAEDYWAFVAVVGERPSQTHLLRTVDPKKPYGPGNWQWIDALRREEGESKKAFNARKWQSRRAAHPTFEPHRHLKRKYGVTADQYAEMLAAQDGKCAICRKPEVAPDQNGRTRALALDHCHETKRVRGLLCFRCNTVIGKMDESPETLRAAAEYLEKHT